MKLLKLLVSLLLLTSLVNCSSRTLQTSDWQAGITLPASQDCYLFNVMSRTETRIPANHPACIEKKERSIWLDFDSYRQLRRDITVNCYVSQCKQITGALDSLFLSIDQALKKIPKK